MSISQPQGAGRADYEVCDPVDFDVLHDEDGLTIVRQGTCYMGELYTSDIDDFNIDQVASPLGLELLDVEETERGSYTLAFCLNQQGRHIERTLNDLSINSPQLGRLARNNDHRTDQPHDRPVPRRGRHRRIDGPGTGRFPIVV